MSIEQEWIAGLPEYQEIVAAIDSFRWKLVNDEVETDFSALMLFAAATSVYRDRCPDCVDRNVTAPHAVVADGEKNVQASYRCTSGHTWTCGWAVKDL